MCLVLTQLYLCLKWTNACNVYLWWWWWSPSYPWRQIVIFNGTFSVSHYSTLRSVIYLALWDDNVFVYYYRQVQYVIHSYIFIWPCFLTSCSESATLFIYPYLNSLILTFFSFSPFCSWLLWVSRELQEQTQYSGLCPALGLQRLNQQPPLTTLDPQSTNQKWPLLQVGQDTGSDPYTAKIPVLFNTGNLAVYPGQNCILEKSSSFLFGRNSEIRSEVF